MPTHNDLAIATIRSANGNGGPPSMYAREQEALRAIIGGTYAKVGDAFFRALVCHLSEALEVRYAFVTECVDTPTTRARTLAFWTGRAYGANFEYALAGTPCEDVIDGSICYHPLNIQALFPLDHDLVTLGAESYLRVPIHDSSGEILGHLAILDTSVMGDADRRRTVLELFAGRCGAELERRRAELALHESEARLRAQEAALRELSTPLIPVSDDVVVIH